MDTVAQPIVHLHLTPGTPMSARVQPEAGKSGPPYIRLQAGSVVIFVGIAGEECADAAEALAHELFKAAAELRARLAAQAFAAAMNGDAVTVPRG